MQRAFFFTILFCALALSGCVSPGPSDLSEAELSACRAKIEPALVFKSPPGQTREYFSKVMASAPVPRRKLLDRYYEVLGRNLSSMVPMLNPEVAGRISLRVESEPAELTLWMEDRLVSGRSLLDLRDVGEVASEGEFLRVAFKPGGRVSGYFYVRCVEIPGRSVDEQTFVDYRTDDGETRKVSVAALTSLLDE